jgi:hypothetical protein
MDRPGVLQFETETLQDTLSVVGFPEVTLYAKTNPAGVLEGPTDTDFHIRIVDVYPDGREMFVVEGCVNARAREYAKSLVQGQENDNAVFENINIGQIYEYNFNMLPMGYTFGREHKMKILISSSNYQRYQSNPNLPIMPNEFFRRRPGDGQTYVFEGQEMEPRVAIQRVAFSSEHPSRIKLPVYNQSIVSTNDITSTVKTSNEILVYPNPTNGVTTISFTKSSDYKIKLFDLVGNAIFQSDFQGDTYQLNTDRMNAGTYLIQTIDQKSGQVKISKLVKR